MRRLAVGRVRRARFRRKIVVALSLPPRDGTERVVAEDVYYRRLGHSGPVTVIEVSSQVNVHLSTMPSEFFIQFCKIFIEFKQMPMLA